MIIDTVCFCEQKKSLVFSQHLNISHDDDNLTCSDSPFHTIGAETKNQAV